MSTKLKTTVENPVFSCFHHPFVVSLQLDWSTIFRNLSFHPRTIMSFLGAITPSNACKATAESASCCSVHSSLSSSYQSVPNLVGKTFKRNGFVVNPRATVRRSFRWSFSVYQSYIKSIPLWPLWFITTHRTHSVCLRNLDSQKWRRSEEAQRENLSI